MMKKLKRKLILILAYEAEKHIAKVIDRLPTCVFNSTEYHILVSDDASTDKTAQIAKTLLNEKKVQNFTIIRLAKNQGYGGNQKASYYYAMEHGYDAVVMIHGDDQYDSSLCLEFFEKMEMEQGGGADVV